MSNVLVMSDLATGAAPARWRRTVTEHGQPCAPVFASFYGNAFYGAGGNSADRGLAFSAADAMAKTVAKTGLPPRDPDPV